MLYIHVLHPGVRFHCYRHLLHRDGLLSPESRHTESNIFYITSHRNRRSSIQVLAYHARHVWIGSLAFFGVCVPDEILHQMHGLYLDICSNTSDGWYYCHFGCFQGLGDNDCCFSRTATVFVHLVLFMQVNKSRYSHTENSYAVSKK